MDKVMENNDIVYEGSFVYELLNKLNAMKSGYWSIEANYENRIAKYSVKKNDIPVAIELPDVQVENILILQLSLLIQQNIEKQINIPKSFTLKPYKGEKLEYGKYLVVREDGKIHFEIYNGTGWAYNHKVITHYYTPAVK